MNEFFFRVAALSFEDAILKELEGAVTQSIGQGDILSTMNSRKSLLTANKSGELFFSYRRTDDMMFLENITKLSEWLSSLPLCGWLCL